MTTQSHHSHVEKQFSSQASEYLISTVHASGRNLQRLTVRLTDYPNADVLDMGCGAEHASFVATRNASAVVAYDLSAHMLDVMVQAAKARQLKNIATHQGYVKSLPFADNTFDAVISRYSAHHQRDVGTTLREMNRILKLGGKLIVMGVISPGHPIRDIWLQTVEALRDISRTRNYVSGEQLTLISEANLIVDNSIIDKLSLEFSSWVARMRTPEALVDAVRIYQRSTSTEVKAYFTLRDDNSFTGDVIMLEAHRTA